MEPAVHVRGQEPLTASMLAAAPLMEEKPLLGACVCVCVCVCLCGCGCVCVCLCSFPLSAAGGVVRRCGGFGADWQGAKSSAPGSGFVCVCVCVSVCVSVCLCELGVEWRTQVCVLLYPINAGKHTSVPHFPSPSGSHHSGSAVYV